MRVRAQLRGLGGAALLALVTLVHPGCAEVLGLQDRPVDDGGTLCDPGATEQCTYSGPTGTNGVGACRAAERVCNAAGTAWGPCQGEITPKPEACDTAADDDCDGEANEPDAGCACIPDQAEACYSGPEGTAGVGICEGGMRTCNADGLGFGPCVGEVLPAVEDCAIKGDEDCSGQPCSDTLWSSIHGDEASQYPRDVAIDTQGNVIVAGSFEGSIAFGDIKLIASKMDVFVVRLTADGQALWAKRFGNSNFQSMDGMTVDKDGNIILIGQFETTIDLGGGPLPTGGPAPVHWFVAKLDPNGDHLWSKTLLKSDYLYVHDVTTDPEGDVILTGSVSGTADFGGASVTAASGVDAFVAKLSGDSGMASWALPFGAGGTQDGLQVRADISGNLVVVGDFGGSISFKNKTYTTQPGEYRLFIARLDPLGGPFFSMEAKGGFGLPSLAVDPDGNILLAAAFKGFVDFDGGTLPAIGTFDVAVARINLAGSTTLLKQIGGPSLTNAGEADEFLAHVGTDAQGNITLITRAIGTVDYGGGVLGAADVPNIFVGKMASDGAHLWSKQFGPVDAPGVCFSDTAQDGTLALCCGEAVSSLDLGTGPLPGFGDLDVFIAKLAP